MVDFGFEPLMRLLAPQLLQNTGDSVLPSCIFVILVRL
jgi:hypothetical protein